MEDSNGETMDHLAISLPIVHFTEEVFLNFILLLVIQRPRERLEVGMWDRLTSPQRRQVMATKISLNGAQRSGRRLREAGGGQE